MVLAQAIAHSQDFKDYSDHGQSRLRKFMT